MFGLDSKTIESVHQVFKVYPAITEARIFGSRALGTHRPNSDIDIALWGSSLNWDVLGKVRSDLDELATPYKFDVVGYNLIEHQELREHIDRVGKLLYSLKK